VGREAVLLPALLADIKPVFVLKAPHAIGKAAVNFVSTHVAARLRVRNLRPRTLLPPFGDSVKIGENSKAVIVTVNQDQVWRTVPVEITCSN
jgi:hypothetical protein